MRHLKFRRPTSRRTRRARPLAGLGDVSVGKDTQVQPSSYVPLFSLRSISAALHSTVTPFTLAPWIVRHRLVDHVHTVAHLGTIQ